MSCAHDQIHSFLSCICSNRFQPSFLSSNSFAHSCLEVKRGPYIFASCHEEPLLGVLPFCCKLLSCHLFICSLILPEFSFNMCLLLCPLWHHIVPCCCCCWSWSWSCSSCCCYCFCCGCCFCFCCCLLLLPISSRWGAEIDILFLFPHVWA